MSGVSRVSQKATMMVGRAGAAPVTPKQPKKSAETAAVKGATYAASTTSVGSGNLTPMARKVASVPVGPWALGLPETSAVTTRELAASVKRSQKQFSAMLASDAPDRTSLVEGAITRRKASIHAYFRGVADARTDLFAKELPASRYPGKAGFVLNTGDMHLYQPTTIHHATHGVMLGVGDSDRLGFGPYEWDVRSLATSVELEGRVHKFPKEARQLALREALEAYVDAIKDVAKAKDPERTAKQLRITKDNTPGVVKDLLARASDANRKDWLEARVTATRPPRLRRQAGVLEDIPNRPAGAAGRITAAVTAALPEFVNSLPPSERGRFTGFTVADVGIPIKGNGSMGYGRYRVLLEPPGGAKRITDLVLVEFKEQLPSALGRHVDQQSTGFYGEDQAARSVALYRVGTGSAVGQGWGHVTLPKGCFVSSRHFTVKEVRPEEKGVDLSGVGDKEFVAMARAQGRLLASFQALAGINAAAHGAGGAKDILRDLEDRPGFVAENMAGAQHLADRYHAEFQAFSAAFA